MTNEIAKGLYDIIKKYHDEYGVSKYADIEWVDFSVIFYGLCTYFTMEESELKRNIKNPSRQGEYYVIKNAVARCIENAFRKNSFDFKQMNDYLNKYFPIVYCATRYSEGEKDERENNFSIDDIRLMFEEVLDEDGYAYSYILRLVDLTAEWMRDNYAFKQIIDSYTDSTGEVDKHQIKDDIKTSISGTRRYFKESLKAKIKGQDVAINKFVDSYMRYKVRGVEPGKPAAVSLFAGPPGTGKTYLAESFANLLKEEGYAYKRFDMSAFGGDNADNVTGLVGFEKTWKSAVPGQLTDFVRRNPKCVLLFDEIEKAGQQVRLLFLSVLEGAVLRDRYYDAPVSFENAIIIFTTNEGKELYTDNRNANLSIISDVAVIDALRKSSFPPELVSRFAAGNIIMFNHLGFNDMMDIFNANIKSAVKKLQNNNRSFEFKYDEVILPQLYMYNKGGYVDARFVSANVKKYVEEQFIKLAELIENQDKDIDNIKNISVAVKISDEVKAYFKQKEKPRVLYFHNGDELKYKKEIQKYAKVDWASNMEELKEKLEKCNWNSDDSNDKYSAFLINIFGTAEIGKKYVDTEGYKCLLYLENEDLGVPVFVEDNKTQDVACMLDQETKNNLIHHLVADFVDVCSTKLKETLAKYYFISKVSELSDNNMKISADISYEYLPKKQEIKISYGNLRVEKATEELYADRAMNKRYLLDKKPKLTLKDIYGNEYAKKAVKRCIDNIKHPEKYVMAGARLMKGILMYGAPGMGKTMFAKAMAYESGAEFISTVGADFMKAGGIEKVEEIFQTARRKKPCIIFIDEFDAISKIRGSISDYEEKVLEKFLKEMDGLETNNEGVYVVGATNYDVDNLDPAITRRFSSKIKFPYPSKEERLQFILHVLKKKGLDNVVSEKIAKTLNLMMYGSMSNYAEIETFFEESIADAVYRGVPVTEKFLINRIHDDTEGEARDVEDIERLYSVAFHEAGHAVLQWLYGRKNEYVTIVSRGDYGGYSMADSKLRTKKDFLEQIRISMAGRAAELLRLSGDENHDDSEILDTGAYSDLQKATSYAYKYVARYGFGTRFTVVPSWLTTEKGMYPENVLPEEDKKDIWKEVESVLKREWEITKSNLRELFDKVNVLAISLIYLKELDGDSIEKVITSGAPLLDESCFEDQDLDYCVHKALDMKEENEIPCPYGFPIYPRSVIKVKNYEDGIYETEEKKYYYAVKTAKQSLGIYEDIRQAVEITYKNGASCRRFCSRKVAEEYLNMLELKVSVQGGRTFVGFKVDALDELLEANNNPHARAIKAEEAQVIKEAAAASDMTLDQYFDNVFVKSLLINTTGDFDLLYQIHDEELKSALIEKWN